MSYCPKCDTNYETNVKICPRDGTVLEATAAKDTRIGETLDGKYRLDAALGQGGMGAIYRATHLMLDKQVAVKLIKPELVTSPDVVRRFQREARAAGNLSHPNIAAAFDLGQTADGTLYIAMELVNGPSLKDVIRSTGPIAVDRTIRIMRQIGSALALAHKHNIIHRDLKPHNVMLATGGGNEVPKLLDFGIAKTFDDASTQLTATGFVLGTPQYMSPEQAAGRPIDGRSDLYSLGIILYEMLIGEVPFNDPSTPAVLVKHLTEPPSPPSSRRPDVQVSPALEGIALRLLAKDPADRFQTADEFIAALPEIGTATVPAISTQDATILLAPSSTRASDATVPVASPASTPTAVPAALAGAAAAAAAAAVAATQATLPPTVMATPTAPKAAPVQPPAPPPVAPAPHQATMPPAPRPIVTPAVAASSTHTSSEAPADSSRNLRNLLVIAALLVLVVGGGAYGAMRLFSGDEAAPPAGDVAPLMQQTQTASAVSPENTAAVSTPSTSPAATTPGAAAVADASKPARTGIGDIPPALDDKPRGPKAPIEVPPAATNRQAPVAAAPALPATPAVSFRCEGAPNVCASLRTAMTDAISRHSLRAVRDAGAADVVVEATVTVVDERSETLYGQNFVTRTYSVEFSGDAKDGESVPMPAASNVTFDASVGQARLEESSRTMSTAAAERVRTFWRGRLGN